MCGPITQPSELASEVIPFCSSRAPSGVARIERFFKTGVALFIRPARSRKAAIASGSEVANASSTKNGIESSSNATMLRT